MKLPKITKPNKSQVRKFIIYSLFIILGNAMAAAAAAFFIKPNELVMGGTTGVGFFVEKILRKNDLGSNYDWAVSLTVYVANIALFILGAILLGKKFAAATAAGTILYPSFLSLFMYLNKLYLEHYEKPIASDNLLLAAICGALLFGCGIGLVVRFGASTGGTDIPPLIFNKYFNLPINVGMWVIDLTVVFMQCFVVPLEHALYGVIIVLVAGFVVNAVSPIGRKRTQMMIVSKKHREIREMILNKMNRGVTMLYGKMGFLQEKTYVLITIVSNRDMVRLKNEVQAIDPNAFLMISVMSEVRGRGFSSDKIALPKSDEKSDLEEVTEINDDEDIAS